MKIHEQIRDLRKQKQLTQEGLADALGVSCAAVSKWESGQNAPDLSTLAELADFFEVSVDMLLGHKVNENRKDRLLAQMDAHTDAREEEKSVAACEMLLRNYPNDPNVVDRCANAYYRLFMFTTNSAYMENCITHTKRLFNLNRGEPEADRLTRIRYLANQYELLEQWQTAKEYYEQSNVMHSDDGNIARCLMKMGKAQEALSMISTTIVEGMFEYYQHVCTLSDIWRNEGNIGHAVQSLEWMLHTLEGIEYSPAIRLFLLIQIASLHLETNQCEKVEAALRKAATLAANADDSWQIDAAVPFLTTNNSRMLLTNTPANAKETLLAMAAHFGERYLSIVMSILETA